MKMKEYFTYHFLFAFFFKKWIKLRIQFYFIKLIDGSSHLGRNV